MVLMVCLFVLSILDIQILLLQMKIRYLNMLCLLLSHLMPHLMIGIMMVFRTTRITALIHIIQIKQTVMEMVLVMHVKHHHLMIGIMMVCQIIKITALIHIIQTKQTVMEMVLVMHVKQPQVHPLST